MIVYATEFPARRGKNLQDVLATAREWLAGSPNQPVRNLPLFTVPSDEVIDLSKDGHQLYVGAVSEQARHLAGVRDAWIELGRQRWVTEIVASQDAEALWVSIRLFCDMLLPGAKPPVPKKPHIVKQLFSAVGGGDDGGIVVEDKPHFLKGSDLDFAVAIISGTLKNHLPIAYVSCDFTGRPSVDVDHAAKRLSGLAHVVVEPNRYFSTQLGRRVRGANPYGGAIGLYWPGAHEHRVKYLPQMFSSSWELISDVEAGARSGWLFWRSPRSIYWPYLQEAISSRRLERVRESGSQSLEEFTVAFDQENAALREQLRHAEARATYLEEALRLARDRQLQRDDVKFAAGDKQVFYPRELHDAILDTLLEDLDGLTKGSRREVLLSDFVTANERSGVREQFEVTLKECLSKSDRISSQQLQRLKDIGFGIADGGKHYKAVYNNDPRFAFTIPKTASDHRSGKNLVSEILRSLFKR